MKNRLLTVLTVGLLMAPSPVLAHHGVAAYDYTKTVIAKAKVAKFDWVNPHCKIYFDTTDDKHNVERWAIELHPPSDLIEHGWTRQTLNPGDAITITFRPAKDGSPRGLVIKVEMANGQELQQNLLLLPPGDTMSLSEWQKYRHRL